MDDHTFGLVRSPVYVPLNNNQYIFRNTLLHATFCANFHVTFHATFVATICASYHATFRATFFPAAFHRTLQFHFISSMHKFNFFFNFFSFH